MLANEGRQAMPSQYSLLELPGKFAVCRLASDAAIPPWAFAAEFFSITRTAEELSILVPQHSAPEGVHCERDWRCLRVAGTVAFAVIGLLAGLIAPLAEAGISVFAVSTFDTDYVLAKEKDWTAAVDILRRQGYRIH
jgi:hypothetical protein